MPWGPASPNTYPEFNNGRLQLPDAAFTLDITNTATVSHTFDVNVTGLPDGWLLLSGEPAAQTQTAVTLPAGGVGQLGLYISPHRNHLTPRWHRIFLQRHRYRQRRRRLVTKRHGRFHRARHRLQPPTS